MHRKPLPPPPVAKKTAAASRLASRLLQSAPASPQRRLVYPVYLRPEQNIPGAEKKEAAGIKLLLVVAFALLFSAAMGGKHYTVGSKQDDSWLAELRRIILWCDHKLRFSSSKNTCFFIFTDVFNGSKFTPICGGANDDEDDEDDEDKDGSGGGGGGTGDSGKMNRYEVNASR